MIALDGRFDCSIAQIRRPFHSQWAEAINDSTTIMSSIFQQQCQIMRPALEFLELLPNATNVNREICYVADEVVVNPIPSQTTGKDPFFIGTRSPESYFQNRDEFHETIFRGSIYRRVHAHGAAAAELRPEHGSFSSSSRTFQ
ncbi:hypothetical protein SAY86_001630 [Trapa natans]|uniref:Uncharacterized protein n=1 Tax=Trapa natans TaxID=22666 RepID=A0AAN7LQ94_TRANT|nr:hypothetical protein SAY86_001630 [Trapa natans]